LNVQVSGAVKEAGVPFVQLELVRVQPAGTVSDRLPEPGATPSSTVAVPAAVARVGSAP
jgi:hypothetical protein